MRTLLTAFAIAIAAGLGGCSSCTDRPATPEAFTCGRLCNSNIECKGDPLQRCAFCNFGTCRGSPPIVSPPDAGVDSGVDSGSGSGSK